MDPVEAPQFQDEPAADAPAIVDLFPNLATSDDVAEKVKIKLRSVFNEIRDRGDLEDIWDKNDEMYRVKPDPLKDVEHRANEATGVFHVAVNQLVGMAYQTFTENPDNYTFGYQAVPGDEQGNIIRERNAQIMTQLLRRAMRQSRFKKQLKLALFDCYKNGTCFVEIRWDKKSVDLVYRDKATGERRTKPITRDNLPGFEYLPIDQVFLDENIGEMDRQPMTFIRRPLSWSELVADSKKNKVALFKPDGEQTLRDKFEGYREYASSSEFTVPETDRFDNAGRTREDRTTELYKHWVVWARLPIDNDGKWDDDSAEDLFRVRIVGDPESCEIIEIRRNIFPCGIPIVAGHQTPDSIGMYPVSLGEKVETYYDQICIAIDQLIDNRAKNCRRPIVYDPMRVTLTKYDYGHSGAIPCEGDVRSAFAELQIADMTGTVMNTIQYCELKVREIMQTTDAVIGVAMGGRTSASEYMGARAAATTPIFSDMASIEDDLIGEYMRRFAQYIHTFMTLDDIVDQVGPTGAEFQFDLADIYTVELRGVKDAMDKNIKVQHLMQLFTMTQDATVRSRITRRIAEAMGLENPDELVVIPAKDQAVKAALWENNEMLLYGQWDDPEAGELHDVHIPIHQQALWQAQRDKNPNAALMEQHLATTKQLQRQEQAMAGGSLPANGQPAIQPALPGSESGQELSAQMGGINAGSPIPASAEPAAPEAI